MRIGGDNKEGLAWLDVWVLDEVNGSSHRYENQNQNELGKFSQGTEEIEKATQNLPTNLLAILLPGVLLDSVNPLLCKLCPGIEAAR